ncbi:MAG: lipoate--protein ligase family protein [Bacteroidales bacterium]
MTIFYRPFTDPYFNIAAEEFFVKHFTEDICMVWLNRQSVIIGKHQNAFAEINYPFVHSQNIPVIRRISGGGAVYHDLGNLNFTFIKKTKKDNQVDFGQFTSIIAGFMQSLGIEVNVNKRNSIFIGNDKISGHAEHIFHDRVLHHGTLLFNTDLEMLSRSLEPHKKYEGKAMPSVRSTVCNIRPHLSEDVDIHLFTEMFVKWLQGFYHVSRLYELTNVDTAAIKKLADEKYETWEWNFGYSPSYSFDATFQLIDGVLPVNLKVENGKIKQVQFPVELLNEGIKHALGRLSGVNHSEEDIAKFAEINSLELELAGIKIVSFTQAFFQ